MDHVGHCDPSSPARPPFPIRCTLALTGTIIRHSCLNSTVALKISDSIRSNISLAHTISCRFTCLLLRVLEPRRGNVCVCFKHRIWDGRFLQSLFLRRSLRVPFCPWLFTRSCMMVMVIESCGAYFAFQRNASRDHMHAMYNIFNTINVKIFAICLTLLFYH